MKFAVPQFIDVEDRFFGPLTIKQAIYLAGGAGFVLFLFVTTGIALAVLLGGPVLLLAAALAFVKINNRSFIAIMESAFYFVIRGKLYLWKKSAPSPHAAAAAHDMAASGKLVAPRISESKLKELAWSLDVHDEKQARVGTRTS